MDQQAEFLVQQQTGLLHAAYLLTGDSTRAQDLVQETVVRLLVAWRRVERADRPEAYAQRVLLNTFLSGRRRRWRGELPHGELPETASTSGYAAVEDHDELRRALLSLPARQRAAVVLRHHQDLSEARTAELLGCSVGTVKSLTSRGLAALRLALAEEAHP